MAKPKIVVLSSSLSAAGGFSTHARTLLGSSLSQEFEMIHFEVGNNGSAESILKKLIRLITSPVALIRLILQKKPGLLHINTGLDQKAYWRDIVFIAIGRLLHVKVLSQIHGGPLPEDFFGQGTLLTKLFRSVLNSCNAIVVLSLKEREAYRRFSPNVLVAHIPNAIDPAPLLGEIRVSDRSRDLRLIYLGRLLREKGLFEVLDAVSQLRRAGRRLGLKIAGGGSAEDALRARARSLGIADIVQFIGPVYGAEKDKLWIEADVFLFPTYSEGLPYSLLEAMAAGTPAVTCAVAAIPDVMADGVHGLFVPMRDAAAIADAVALLDDDRDLLEKMAQAGRARLMQQYTTERLVNDFRALYMTILEQSSMGSSRLSFRGKFR